MTPHPMRFRSAAVPEDTFLLSRFEGTERLSGLYRFELELFSKNADVDFGAMLKRPATVELDRGTRRGDTVIYLPPIRIHGRLESVEATGRHEGGVRYRAVLVPRISKLALTWRSRVFQNKTVPQMVTETLTEAGFEPADYEIRLAGTHQARDYVVQYEESDLDFLSRWLEHEGIFTFFRHGENAETIVFADDVEAYPEVGEEPIPYRPDPPEASDWFGVESVAAIAGRQESIPKKVILKDYNWRQPTIDLTVEETVDPAGEGVVFEYNNHYRTREEGAALAQIRAQEIRCREKGFRGSGNCRRFRAGAKWTLSDPYRRDFEMRYVLTEVTHRASLNAVGRAEYANEFRAIPADRVFRPQRVTPWPAIKGTMHAKVDASGSGEYAEVDQYGQYKVKLPIDLSEVADGQASRYVRMAQPYAGADHGMHFPLHKGTEVLLTHLDGDPDRPVIAGAVPNAATSSVVSRSNQTKAGVRTSGGNEIAIEDSDGHQRIHLRAGTGKSAIYVGAGSPDRIDISSPWVGVAGTMGSLIGSMFSDTTGAISSAMTSGFLPAQLGLWLLRSGMDIGGTALGAFMPGGDKPWDQGESQKKETDPWPIAASTITFLTGKLVSTLIMKFVVLPKLVKYIEGKGRGMEAKLRGYDRWYNYLYVPFINGWQHFLTKIATTKGFGAYLVRCGDGSRLQLNAKGEDIVVATEKGVLALGGDEVAILGEKAIHANAADAIGMQGNEGHLLMSKEGSALSWGAKHMVQLSDTLGAEITSSKNVALTTTGNCKWLLGKETFVNLTPDQLDLSGQKGVNMYAADQNVVLTEKTVSINAGSGDTLSGIQIDGKGNVIVFGKKLELNFESISVGDSTCDVTVAGKSLKIESQTTLDLTSGAPAQLNGSAIAVLPKPPPPRPPRRPANVAKALEILGLRRAPGPSV